MNLLNFYSGIIYFLSFYLLLHCFFYEINNNSRQIETVFSFLKILIGKTKS